MKAKDRSPLYQNLSVVGKRLPTRWDVTAFLILFGVIAALGISASQMTTSYEIGKPTLISLSPLELPLYALHSIFRMLIAVFISLTFTFIVAPLAAKNRLAEKFIIPLIDVLQAVPILGYLSITVVFFIQVFPNNLLGPQCAAIFAIFTSQVWNMTLSAYQSFRTVPKEFYDTAAVFQLTAWHRFWRIEVPFAWPGLIWNTIMSMSAGWFFVVASEAITVSNHEILLPGIGSYISVAISRGELLPIIYAIITMLVVILLYDQLLFRPLLTWTEQFKSELEEESETHSWFYDVLIKARFLKRLHSGLFSWGDVFMNPQRLFPKKPKKKKQQKESKRSIEKFSKILPSFWYGLFGIGVIVACFFLYRFITQTILISEIVEVFKLGAITLFKIVILIGITSLIWLPVGVWIGLNPKARHFIQPLTQFLASFPINLLYPLAVTVILYYHLNIEIWTTPLMILSTQWYMLYNIIAGAANIPKELRLTVSNFSLSPWLKWKKLLFPAIFPYYITGAMTAAGGCWNVSIVTEVLSWGDRKLVATGLGSYITQHTIAGDFQRIALGIAVMCFYVILIDRFVWHKLYNLASERYVME